MMETEVSAASHDDKSLRKRSLPIGSQTFQTVSKRARSVLDDDRKAGSREDDIRHSLSQILDSFGKRMMELLQSLLTPRRLSEDSRYLIASLTDVADGRSLIVPADGTLCSFVRDVKAWCAEDAPGRMDPDSIPDALCILCAELEEDCLVWASFVSRLRIGPRIMSHAVKDDRKLVLPAHYDSDADSAEVDDRIDWDAVFALNTVGSDEDDWDEDYSSEGRSSCVQVCAEVCVVRMDE
jgi:hypothetical protein